MHMTLKETRLNYRLTQTQASSIVGVPLRTYRRYETDEDYGDELKRSKFIDILNDKCSITETKGLLSIDQIKESLVALFDSQYQGVVEFCYFLIPDGNESRRSCGSYQKRPSQEDRSR